MAAACPSRCPTAFRFGAPAGDDLPLIDPAMQAAGAAQPRTAAGDATIACQLGLLAIALSRLDSRASRQVARSRVAEARPLTERFLELAQAELAQSQTIAEMAGKLGHSQAQLDRACRQSRGRGALDCFTTCACNAPPRRCATRPGRWPRSRSNWAMPGLAISSAASRPPPAAHPGLIATSCTATRGRQGGSSARRKESAARGFRHVPAGA